MIRFVLKAISLFALVVAVMAGTIDAIQSVSASQPVLTPLGSAVSASGDRGLALVQSLERSGGPAGVLQPVALWMLQQPAFAVFMALALALWMIAYRKPPVAGRFSA